jgi:DNA-binding CsgD family transcriptional regulator/tetratricopeptide (TPR) repeat protein
VVIQRVSSPSLIAREPELAALAGALDRAHDGRAATVFVAGDSGVGKSRLLDEFARHAEERGTHVLAGECVTLAAGELPYGAIRAALRPLEAELRALPEADRAQAARLLPQLGAPGASEAGLAATGERLGQAHLFEVLLGVLGRLGEHAPVVLVVEDIHWADPSTLDFLGFLMANVRRERLLLVCSYRTDELHSRHPLRPFLARHERRPDATRIELRPFTVQELEALVLAIREQAPEPGLVARLHERGEGNAFFTEELLAAAGREPTLPASVRDVLMLRIEQLSPAAQQVLRVAAAHGRLVPHRLLAAATDLPEPDLHEALREAVAHHVLVRRDMDTFAFRHALLVEALTADALPGERAASHLALAEALERDPSLGSRDGRAAAESCRHWLGAHRLREGLAAAVRAAQEAEDVYAFSEAAHHYLRVLELWDQVPEPAALAGMDAVELHGRAAEAAAFGDDGASALRLVRAAVALVDPAADPRRAAMLRERQARYLWLFSGDNEGAQRAYQEAVDLLPPDEPGPELAMALASLSQILVLRGSTTEAIERGEQAIAMARRTGARSAEALALNAMGTAAAFVGDRATGSAQLQESLAMSEGIGDLDIATRGYVNTAEVLDQDGRTEESIELARRGAERVRAHGLRDSSLLLEGEAAVRLVKLGRLDEAAALVADAAALRPSLAKLDQCAVRARILVHRGAAEEAERMLRAAEGALPFVPATWMEPLGSVRLELALLRGQPEEAWRTGTASIGAAGDGEHVAFVARIHALTARAGAILAERARAAGDTARADALHAEIEALSARFDARLERAGLRGSPPPEALAQRALCAAEQGRAAGHASHAAWTAAAERCRALGLVLDEAYAGLQAAEGLLLDGDRAAAGAVLARGLEQTAAAGATWLREQQEALARRARLTALLTPGEGAPEPGASVADHRMGLTERELEVLELLAQGMTNRQIGERLFMATKTASVHVSRIFTKLGAESRVEAATAAQRLGLVP